MRCSVLSAIIKGSKFLKLSKHMNILKKKFTKLKKVINLSARNAPL